VVRRVVVGIFAAAGAGLVAEVVFGAGGGLFFFWSAPATTVISIITKSIIIILVTLALDIFVLLAFCRFFLWFLDVPSTVENVISWKIP
jgi:hypothetical protein